MELRLHLIQRKTFPSTFTLPPNKNALGPKSRCLMLMKVIAVFNCSLTPHADNYISKENKYPFRHLVQYCMILTPLMISTTTIPMRTWTFSFCRES